MRLYMFRTVPLFIIRSLFTVHSAMVYVIQDCRQLSSRSICKCPPSESVREWTRLVMDCHALSNVRSGWRWFDRHQNCCDV